MPRVMVLASGTRGDVQPAVALSSYLSTCGYDVTICGGLNIKDLADAYDCRFITMGEDNEAFVARAPDPTRQPVKATRALTEYVLKELEIQFNQLPEKAIDADLILGATFGFAAASVAEALNIPFGYMAYCPQVLQSSHHPALFVKSHRHSQMFNRMSWYCFKALINASYRSSINKNRAKLGLEPIRDCWEHILGPNILLLCDNNYTAVPSDVRKTCFHSGYLPMHKHEDLDDDLLQFIETGSIPVFVGFGSMTDQFYFAEQVPKLGIAPESIWRKHLTPKRLANAINAAISDAGMQQRCKSLAEKLARHHSYVLAEKYIREEFLK